jgi:LmbE family N-acetylglucosaminyl deacetylase
MIPDLFSARRVLCFQPHYDDADIGAGGILALLHDRGVEVSYVTITDDLVGVIDVDLPDEQASEQLRNEQLEAGAIIGVDRQIWLDYPDSGDYNYFDMRRQVIRLVRLFKPDFLLAPDPWLPYEAHRDHINTGLAVAEASYLHTMKRLKTDPEVDASYRPYLLEGVAFYFTRVPNLTVDITGARERKRRALACYRGQFGPQELAYLLSRLEEEERAAGQAAGYEYAEVLKVLRTEQLHISIHTLEA